LDALSFAIFKKTSDSRGRTLYGVEAVVWAVVLPYLAAMVLGPSLAVAKGGSPRAGAWTFVLLAGSMAISAAVAARGLYRQTGDHDPVWVGIPMFGLLVILMWATRLPAVAKATRHPRFPVWLALAQSTRLAGLAFLLETWAEHLSPIWGWPAGVGDLIVGFTGLALVIRAYQGRNVQKGLFWFNVFGLFDIAVAFVIGFTSARGLFQVLHTAPSVDPLTVLPLALIPSIGVPIMVTMHIVSLRRLRTRAG
jgi:hypothetical protein